MNKILLATAAVAVLASPALAASARHTAPIYGQAAPFGTWQQGAWQGQAGAYAQSGLAVQPYGQTLGKDYVGTDPDSNVRLQLLKDQQSRD